MVPREGPLSLEEGLGPGLREQVKEPGRRRHLRERPQRVARPRVGRPDRATRARPRVRDRTRPSPDGRARRSAEGAPVSHIVKSWSRAASQRAGSCSVWSTPAKGGGGSSTSQLVATIAGTRSPRRRRSSSATQAPCAWATGTTRRAPHASTTASASASSSSCPNGPVGRSESPWPRQSSVTTRVVVPRRSARGPKKLRSTHQPGRQSSASSPRGPRSSYAMCTPSAVLTFMRSSLVAASPPAHPGNPRGSAILMAMKARAWPEGWFAE